MTGRYRFTFHPVTESLNKENEKRYAFIVRSLDKQGIDWLEDVETGENGYVTRIITASGTPKPSKPAKVKIGGFKLAPMPTAEQIQKRIYAGLDSDITGRKGKYYFRSSFNVNGRKRDLEFGRKIAKLIAARGIDAVLTESEREPLGWSSMGAWEITPRRLVEIQKERLLYWRYEPEPWKPISQRYSREQIEALAFDAELLRLARNRERTKKAA